MSVSESEYYLSREIPKWLNKTKTFYLPTSKELTIYRPRIIEPFERDKKKQKKTKNVRKREYKKEN